MSDDLWVKLRRSMQLPATIAFIALVAYLLFDLKVLSSHNWDPRVFIMARRPEVPKDKGWDIGYDAQYYYSIAADPLGAAQYLDLPAYRYQRIVYPALIRLTSFGVVEWMPWTMLGINLVAVSVVSGILAALLSQKGTSPWYALIFPSSLGFMLAMRMNLLEPLTLTLALSGWIAYKEEKPAVSILLFSLSALTKEIGLVFPAALAGWLLLRGKWRNAIGIAGGSALPYLVWKIYLTNLLGTTSGVANVTRLVWVPFSGFFAIKDPYSMMIVGLWAFLPSVLAGFGLVVDVIKKGDTSRQNPEVFLAFAHVVLLACMPVVTWMDPLAVLRTGSGLIIGLSLWLAACHKRALPYLAALYAPSGLLMAIVPGML